MAKAATSASQILAAARLEKIRYAIRDMAAIAEQLVHEGKEIIPLNIGDPLAFDFRVPPHLIEAVAKAMRDGKNGYAPSLGVDEALEAIRAAAERKGIHNIQSVFITHGVSEAVDICLSALVNPGENALTPRPDYPLYSAILTKLGATPNPYPLDEEADWQPDLDELASRIGPATRAIVVINPNNPTGAVYSRATLETVADLARRHGLLILADEIYDELLLEDDSHISVAALAPDVPVVTFGGLSKGYLVPGWRLGWAVVSGPAKLLAPYLEGVYKLLRTRLCGNHPQQYAIRPALEGPQNHVEESIGKLRARRDLTMRWCSSTPRLRCVSPRGAFYAFPRLQIDEDDEIFAKQLLIEKQVWVVHGGGFGQAPGTRHFRLVFLPDEATLTRAFERVSEFLQERYP